VTPREFAERALLGSLMCDPSPLPEMEAWLAPEDFKDFAHGVIYRHLQEMSGQQEINPVDLHKHVIGSGEPGTHAISAPYMHTLMATAPPPSQARPERYALMIVEASIRRDVEQGGLRVGQYVDEGADMTAMLDAVETALDGIKQAQHRWETLTEKPRSIQQILNPEAPTSTPAAERGDTEVTVLAEPPDDEQVAAAEADVVGGVLQNPATLDALASRLLPDDFTDPALATTYRTAADLRGRGEHVDPVTVAWEQQRHAAEHGPGLHPDTMLSLTGSGPAADPRYQAEVVMRGSLARLTRSAAETVREAAQHPGLAPTEMLRTSQLAYESVHTAAARMTSGPENTAARLACLSSPTPIGTALAGASTTSPATVQPIGPARDVDRGR
jgi:replicative DNA helicase